MLKSEQFQDTCKKYSINTLYLFGSFVDGSFSEDSDIDLAYLSYNSGIDYGQLYFELQEHVNRKIDLVDLRKAPLSIGYGIIKDGKVIYDADKEIRTDFEDEIVKKYLDFSTYYRLMQAELDDNFGVEAHNL